MIQTSLLSYRKQLENEISLVASYVTFQNANNQGADQTARMRRLVCACVVSKPPKTGFLASRPIYNLQFDVFMKFQNFKHKIRLQIWLNFKFCDKFGDDIIVLNN